MVTSGLPYHFPFRALRAFGASPDKPAFFAGNFFAGVNDKVPLPLLALLTMLFVVAKGFFAMLLARLTRGPRASRLLAEHTAAAALGEGRLARTDNLGLT